MGVLDDIRTDGGFEDGGERVCLSAGFAIAASDGDSGACSHGGLSIGR